MEMILGYEFDWIRLFGNEVDTCPLISGPRPIEFESLAYEVDMGLVADLI